MKTLFTILTLAFASASFLSAKQLESVKIVDIDGQVFTSQNNGSEERAAVNSVHSVGTSFITKSNGSAKLVLSNGSRINMEPNSKITLRSFQQGDYEGNRTFSQLNGDPSTSQVTFELDHGTISGNALRLQPDSALRIRSEMGTAVVTGTSFVVSLVFDVETQAATFSVMNADGTIVYQAGAAGMSGPIAAGDTLVVRLPVSDERFAQLFGDLPAGTPITTSQGAIAILQPSLGQGPALPGTPGSAFAAITTDDSSLVVVSPETGN